MGNGTFMLCDEQISHLICATPEILNGIDALDYQKLSSSIQPASIDLHIGQIFTPGAKPGELGAHDAPRRDFTLMTGQTAVIRTREQLKLPDDIAGIAFPPSSVSLRGLLMTNPGHVDPGYHGYLHVTAINMGQEPYPLVHGARCITLTLFRLARAAAAPYSTRIGAPSTSPVTQELLTRLSLDFAAIENRAEKIADKAAQKMDISTKRIQVIATIIIAVLTVGGYIITSRISERIATLEAQIKIDALEERIEKLERSVDATTGPPQSGP